MKKILFVALKWRYGQEKLGEGLNYRAHSKVLTQLGYEVKNIWIDQYDNLQSLNSSIIDIAYSFNPDLVFFKLFRHEIYFDTLCALRNKFPVINWFGDDHWRFYDFSFYYANYFDICITTDKFSVPKYERLTTTTVIRSQYAAFNDCINQVNDDPYKYDVSFIGAANSYRRWFINHLKKYDINVECFGHGWRNGHITFDQMNQIIRQSKINLNISNSQSHDIRYIFSSPLNLMRSCYSLIKKNKKDSAGIKARIFEIPVNGGFELTEYVPSLEEYYTLGNNLVCFNTIDELPMLINYYLHNPLVREEIKERSIQHSRSNHLYQSRMKDIMIKVEKILS